MCAWWHVCDAYRIQSFCVFHPSVQSCWRVCILKILQILITNTWEWKKKDNFELTISWTDDNSTKLSFLKNKKIKKKLLCSFIQWFYFLCFTQCCSIAWICYMPFPPPQSSEYWHESNLVSFALSLMHWILWNLNVKCLKETVVPLR